MSRLGRIRLSCYDIFLTVLFLCSGQSAKSRFCELKGYKAAIGDLTLSAKTGPSGSVSNIDSLGNL